MKKNIVIFGSVGVNQGDDLMSRVLVNACLANNAEPVIASIYPEIVEYKYKVKTFPSSLKSIIHWISYIKNADIIIIGGGTLIQDEFGTKKIGGILLYSAMAILISKLIFKKRVIGVGIGVNKVNKVNELVAKSYRLCDRFIVRDEASIKNSKALCIHNAEKMPDLGLCLEYYDEYIKSTFKSDEKYAAISLVREDIESTSFEIGEKIIEYSLSKGMRIILIAMDVRDSEELYIYKKLKKINPELIDIIVPKMPYEILGLLAKSNIVIGMRLHFCILSLVSGNVPLVIGREEKLNWIQEYFKDEIIINARSENVVKSVCEKLSTDYFIDKKLSVSEAAKIKEESSLIKKTLDEIINAR